ncbi:MAG: NAD(P)/FAD-dependent oxidoreductase [Bacteroidota bacterium]
MVQSAKYDVFVIGSGTAGQEVATSCAEKGLKVAIADKRAFGGTCANRGCDPKKVMLTFAEIMDSATRLLGYGVEKIPQVSWEKIQNFKKTFTDHIPIATEKKLKELSIDLYHQSPQFLDAQVISVAGKTIQADYYVIASGLEPIDLAFEGGHLAQNSDDFLNLDELPKSAIFIGAGYIGMEFAHLLNTMGCDVTVLDRSQEILSNFEMEIAAALRKSSERKGIKFDLNADIDKLEQFENHKQVSYKKNSQRFYIDAEIVFNTAGRKPAIDALGLESGEIKASEKGITVNKYLQSTSNPQVYACGDVSDHSLPLTPLSGLEGQIVSKNIIEGNATGVGATTVPSAVFTLPNVAKVGMSEAEARSRYKNVKISIGEGKEWFNAKRQQEETYTFKIISNERTDEIVGAHLVGPQAAETINLFALAIINRMTNEKLKSTLLTYPTMGYDIRSML